MYIFTSFPIPNLFANLQSTMISVMIGSYSASAIMYMLFKVTYCIVQTGAIFRREYEISTSFNLNFISLLKNPSFGEKRDF